MLRNMLIAAFALDYVVIVNNPDDAMEPDYVGADLTDALDAIEAVDETEIEIVDENGDLCGWALIVNGLDEDEQIADCSGWVNRWTEDNG